MNKAFSGELSFLSNYYPCSVDYEGITYPSSEHVFAASKITNIKERYYIKELPTPGQAKRAGREVELRSCWNTIRYSIMKDILVSKFTQNPDLKEKLLLTGDDYLEETNYWGDIYWGVCNGVGENNLGKILMELRSKLRNIK